MSEPLCGPASADRLLPQRLSSWKAIAAYLKRDVTTVQRWERREGMPVHRHLHDKRGSVYALASELDVWRERRSALVGGNRVETAAAVPSAAEAARGPARRLLSRRSFAWALTVLIGLALAAIPHVLRRERVSPAAPTKIASLAVLPFRNLSSDPAQEYLADGMTEAIIGRLAGLHGLRVVSHTSVMRFKNPEVSLPQIGRALGVDAIVEGSVIHAGNRIRVTAQLVRAASDEHFWSENYDRKLENVLSLESELAQAIAEKVEVTVSGPERARLAAARAVSPEVYESYLKGRFAYNRGRNKRDFETSAGHFQRAIGLDPTFAPAYVGLAEAFTQLGTVGIGRPPGETRPRVLRAARRALELDPSLAEAHVLLANTEQERWQWAEAEMEYRSALDLSPNDAEAHWQYALWLVCQGRTDEAVSWVQRGRRLDPLAVSGTSVAWILFQSHRFAEAARELRSALAVQPDDQHALTALGFVLSANGHPADAIAPLERAVFLSSGSPAAIGVLIHAYARAGRRAEALQLLADLERRRAAGYVPAAAFVNGYLGLGDTDRAFQWLEQAYAEQSNILQFLKVHPFFDPIRSDPRFADLIRRVWSEASRDSG
ncbi:MAG: tetratricopeptide repeat protein [Steroidobacteraceae bacterium]